MPKTRLKKGVSLWRNDGFGERKGVFILFNNNRNQMSTLVFFDIDKSVFSEISHGKNA